jgi:hypothetical protein
MHDSKSRRREKPLPAVVPLLQFIEWAGNGLALPLD